MYQTQNIKRQVIFNIIYLVVVIGLTALAFYLTVGNRMEEIGHTLKSANIWYIILILIVVIGCIITRSIVIFSLTRIFNRDYSFHRAIAIDQIGSLYRMITPAGLGSHFMTAYIYTKQKVKLSSALSVLAMYSIVYQIVLILYGLITIIVKHDLINEIGYVSIAFNSNDYQVPLWLLISIGFTFNALVIGFILLISYWNGFYRFIRGPILTLLKKIHLVKSLSDKQKDLDDARDNFRNNLKTLLKNGPVFVVSITMFFIYITISYSVPYICGLALNNASPTANFWDSVLLSNFHQMVTCIIPIPGSSVVSELFFYRLFYPTSGPKFYSSEEIARASLLLWRSLMFIIPLIIACIYTLIYRPRGHKKIEAIKYDNQQNQNPQE